MSLPSRDVRPRTRAGRLRFLDQWVVHEVDLSPGCRVIDLGFGQTPDTVIELAQAVRVRRPSLEVVGLERFAVPAAPGVTLLQGDFETVRAMREATLVRAMNVLRGYREDEVPALHAALLAPLAPGGLALEGSTDTEGHVTVVHLLGRDQLLFHTDFTRGFSPWLFRDWLPRTWRRKATPGTAIHALLTQWEAAAGQGLAPRERFLHALDALPALQATAWEREHGFVRWSVA